MVVTHLNASVGPVLTVEHLAMDLSLGKISALSDGNAQGKDSKLVTASALVGSLFIEIDPELIVQCAYEAGSDLMHANMLYEDALRHGMPRAPEWERSIAFLI
jgi:hypothetical protein